jgi:LuxR family maltose regulon positive regulatory protein
MSHPLLPLAATSTSTGNGPRMVVRERLLRILSQAGDAQVALLVAPAGYGKSTLLSQWAESDARPSAVIATRPADNDPRQLLESIARALSAVAPLDEDVFIALSRPGGSRPADALGALERSLSRCPPFLLGLDDVEVLSAPASIAALAVVAQLVPAGSQLALAARREPALPIGRLRAQRRLVELRSAELAMTRREAAAVLRACGLELATAEEGALVRRTAGWPAGLSLAALALQHEADPARAIGRFGGANRFVADYLRDEVMAGLSGDATRFLLRTSILDVLSGPACDATLGRSGSGAVLRDLVRANVMLVPLDQSDDEYRYHPLFAEMLAAELHRAEPERVRELQRRAAAFYADGGDLDQAIHHTIAAGDAAAAGRLLWSSVAPQVLSGRTQSVRAWLDRFSARELTAEPGLALTEAAAHLVLGDRDLVEHWSAAAQHALEAVTAEADRATLDAGVTVMRAAVGRHGLRRMADDAATAYALTADDSPWRSLCCLLAGVGAHLAGDRERARSSLREGVRRGGIAAPAIQVLCLAQLTLLALDEEDWPATDELSSRARSQVDRVGLGECPIAALVFAVSARVRAQRGRAEQAQEDRRATASLLGRITEVAPWYACQVRIVLAGAALRLGDLAGTRTLVAEASRIARELPDAVVLGKWIRDATTASDALAESVAVTASSLTTAELRVLQLLPTHLSFREMAEGLHVSANTVKTHAHAVYRKLDACSRSEAVLRAREAGLL